MVFGAIEMGTLIKKFANRKPAEIADLRRAMVTLIVRTLCNSIEFQVYQGKLQAPKPYMAFAQMIHQTLRNAEGPNYSFITFNYDIALDYALYVNNIPTDYCLAGDIAPTSDAVSLLKLHGSVNWRNCVHCAQVFPIEMEPISGTLPDFSQRPGPQPFYIDVSSDTVPKLHPSCNKNLETTPVIVPPTWDKSSHHSKLTGVWRIAAKELGEAENIFVIGYSLPESDLFFRYLFALGSEGRTRIKRFWVFNPDKKAVEPRFRRLIGPSLENRFEFFDQPFENALPLLNATLKEIYK